MQLLIEIDTSVETVQLPKQNQLLQEGNYTPLSYETRTVT